MRFVNMRYPVLLFFCCLFAARVGYGQVCTGSFGDPIKNIDFGSGNAAFGPALGTDASGKQITTYPYVAGFPQDGQYTITNNTSNLNHSTWWSTSNHTPVSGGYMMVVNASNNPGIFYTETVDNLCPGTTYEFAAWVMNLATSPVPSKPNITFQISNAAGTILQSYNTQTILESGSAVWQQYAMQFTTPSGNGVVTLTMINNGPGGNGNDIALDDITFRPCGPVLTPVFQGSNNTAQNTCVSNTAQTFTMSVSDAGTSYTNPKYQWEVNKNDGMGWGIISGEITKTYTATIPANTTPGTYQYRMASADGNNINYTTCRVYSPPLTLTINALPIVNPPPTAPVCEGQALSITLTGSDPNNTYTWARPDGTTYPPSPNLVINNAQLSDAGTYTVTVKNTAGCTVTASTKVTVGAKVTATVSPDVSICENGNGTQLSASGGTTYLWSPAAGLNNPNIANPTANPTQTTVYTVTVSNSSGCSATAQITVNVTNKPIVKAGGDQKMTEGQSITLDGYVDANATSYHWTPATGLSDPNVLHPTARPIEDITYTLVATTGNPCNFLVSDDVFIRVYKKVVVPNTFTPNGDGINDSWNIIALETYPESHTQVFNRLGRLVYQSQGYSKQWDGTTNGNPLPEGTYYYKIDLKPGTVLSGWVVIVR